MALPLLNALFVAVLVATVFQAESRISLPSGLNEKSTACYPRQAHIALTGDPQEMTVSWTTKGSRCASEVEFWPLTSMPSPAANALQLVQGTAAAYDNADFCASPARDYAADRQYLHHVTLRGLQPGKQYVYKIRGGDSEMSFQSALPPDPSASFTFLAYADMGESQHEEAKSPGAADTQREVRRAVENGAELVLHVGDISYADGRLEVWETFMESISPYASRVPYMVAVGNHEYDYAHQGSHNDPSGADRPFDPEWGNFGNDSGGECGVATSVTFSMPASSDYGYWPLPLPSNCSAPSLPGGGTPAAEPAVQQICQAGPPPGTNPTLGPFGGAASAGNFPAASAATTPLPADSVATGGNMGVGQSHPKPNPPFWYSFSYGSVHFVMVSTEHNLAPGSKQYQWLEYNLARVDRCKTPWLVVGMHRPLYVVYPHHSNRLVGEHLRGQVEGLLSRYEVDLVLSGHVHSYSRTCNVEGGRCVDPAEGGMIHATVGCGGHQLSGVADEQPEWSDFAESRFGFGRVSVKGSHSLLWEYIRSEDGGVHDWIRLDNRRTARRGCDAVASPSRPAHATHAAELAEAAAGTSANGRQDGETMASTGGDRRTRTRGDGAAPLPRAHQAEHQQQRAVVTLGRGAQGAMAAA